MAIEDFWLNRLIENPLYASKRDREHGADMQRTEVFHILFQSCVSETSLQLLFFFSIDCRGVAY